MALLGGDHYARRIPSGLAATRRLSRNAVAESKRRGHGRVVGYPEAIVEMQALPSGLAHYYNRRCAVFKPSPRLAAGNVLAPTLPLALTKFYGAKSAKNVQKTTF